jgi:hypothetical protein
MVVGSTNTVIQPVAMVIEFVAASVAGPAMLSLLVDIAVTECTPESVIVIF